MRTLYQWIIPTIWLSLVVVTSIVLLDTAHLAWTMRQPTWIGSRHDACCLELGLLIVSPVAALVGVCLPGLWLHSGVMVRRMIGASMLGIVALMTVITIFWP